MFENQCPWRVLGLHIPYLLPFYCLCMLSFKLLAQEVVDIQKYIIVNLPKTLVKIPLWFTCSSYRTVETS